MTFDSCLYDRPLPSRKCVLVARHTAIFWSGHLQITCTIKVNVYRKIILCQELTVVYDWIPYESPIFFDRRSNNTHKKTLCSGGPRSPCTYNCLFLPTIVYYRQTPHLRTYHGIRHEIVLPSSCQINRHTQQGFGHSRFSFRDTTSFGVTAGTSDHLPIWYTYNFCTET